uniref:Predicted AAA-ATPase n=1 Tax=Candidatus Kentrum sp. FM TaxID=2126340 RepID=A0A450T187_9GAMM|nr:MAG: Predicted AAA-ATPase [Candidatus Kentron sp. FM]VFJ60180.1 MAG: Predicted AAA-ATPase [Candidatus Kentron sp. FM]VFK12421.1 MAG: Predicted AAA-ATPase [Candidatus Kentron sp. FM]
METPKKLPIGIQGFEKLRQGGYVYVDKTEQVHSPDHGGRCLKWTDLSLLQPIHPKFDRLLAASLPNPTYSST